MIEHLFDSKENFIALKKNQNTSEINGDRIGRLKSCTDRQSSNRDKSNIKYDPYGILKDYMGNKPSALLMEGDIPTEMLELLQDTIPPELLGKSKKKKKY